MVELGLLLDWSSKWNYYPPFNLLFWNNGEPNQFGGANEDYAHNCTRWAYGSWNDLTGKRGSYRETINLKVM
jgi:hypothetical protein